jgi:hypothetical protein
MMCKITFLQHKPIVRELVKFFTVFGELTLLEVNFKFLETVTVIV